MLPTARLPVRGYAAPITEPGTGEIAEKARHLARMVENGRQIAAAIRHLDSYGADPSSQRLAEVMASFLVERCESRHPGWRVVRQVIVDSQADAPWERCARRAVTPLTDDLLRLSEAGGRTPLHRAQHQAARRRAEAVAPFVEADAVLRDLGLASPADLDEDRWAQALMDAVRARSREGVGRRLQTELALEPVET